MSYPNLPLSGADWQRRATQTINSLLNEASYYVYNIEGLPSAGQEVIDVEFPINVHIDPVSSDIRLRNITGIAPTSDAVFTFSVAGVTIGTGTIPAGEDEGTLSLTSTSIPAFTRFLVTAPDPQDATLSDIIISLAIDE